MLMAGPDADGWRWRLAPVPVDQPSGAPDTAVRLAGQQCPGFGHATSSFRHLGLARRLLWPCGCRTLDLYIKVLV